MIHLDTNVLIVFPRLVSDGHPLIRRIAGGDPVAVSAMAWFEFRCGSAKGEELQLTHASISNRILPVNEGVGDRGAFLFNASGRKRALRTDCLIAATAILADAELATFNGEDFRAFVPHGLKLMEL